MKVKRESEVSQSYPTWTAAYQAPAPMGFSRQEYWNGVPLPSQLALSFYFFLVLISLCTYLHAIVTMLYSGKILFKVNPCEKET